MAVSSPFVPRMRRSRWFGAALDGVNVGSLALMAVVTARIAHSALVDPWTVGILAASALLLLRWRVNSAWLVLGGALLGLMIGT